MSFSFWRGFIYANMSTQSHASTWLLTAWAANPVWHLPTYIWCRFIIAATFLTVLILYSCSAKAGQFSLGIGVAPIIGEETVFTESLVTATYRIDSKPIQFYATKTQLTNIYGAEAIYPFPRWHKDLELFLGFAYQTEHKHNYIVGSPVMYSFGFQFPVYDSWRFVFRHQSSGNYLRGPLCGSRHRCDNVANSGWNSLNLEYVWLF